MAGAATAVGDVILRIGTKLGPGGFASLKSAIDMVKGMARTVLQAAKATDQFNASMTTANMEFVNYANAASKGQVGTAQLVQSLAELNQAGIKVTKEEFKVLSAAVTDFAIKTGQDVPQSMDRLVKAIRSGSSETLRPFGVFLKMTGDVTKFQADAVRELTSRYKDLEVELTTTSQRLDQLSDNMGTFSATLWDVVQAQSAIFQGANIGIDVLNRGVGALANSMTELTRKERLWYNTWDYHIWALRMDWAKLRNDVEGIQELSEEAGQKTGREDLQVLTKRQQAWNEYYRQQNELAMREVNQAERYYEREIATTAAPEDWEYGLMGQQSRGYDAARKTVGEGKAGGGAGGFLFDPGREMAANVRPEVAFWARTMGLPYDSFEAVKAANKKYDEFKYYGGEELIPGGAGRDVPSYDFQAGQGYGAAGGKVDAEMKKMQAEEEKYARHREKFMERLAQQSYSARGGTEGYFDTTQGMIAQAGLTGADSLTAEQASITQLDEYIERQQTAEDIREEHFDNWLERIGEERVWQLEQIQFASDFREVWRDALDSVSAGTMAGQASMDLLKGTWDAAVTSAVTGQKTFGAAMRDMTRQLGLAVAKEAGWKALMQFAEMIAALASYRYAAAAQHAIAGAKFSALAIAAGAASAASYRSGGSGSGAAAGGGGGGDPANPHRFSSAGRASPSYGQTYPAGGNQQKIVNEMHVYLGEKEIYYSVKEEDDTRGRAGQSTIGSGRAA